MNITIMFTAVMLIANMVCTPPGNWNKTKRFLNNKEVSSTFKVDVLSLITMKTFWFQDYGKDGCPNDCEANPDDCQKGETGKVKTPFGTVNITDGNAKPANGNKRQQGVLTPGTYTVTIQHTGGEDSLNIGYTVDVKPVGTPPPTKPPATVTPTIAITPTMYVVTPSPTFDLTPPHETKPPPGITETPYTPSTLPPPATPKKETPQVLLPVSGNSGRELTCLGPVSLVVPGFLFIIWRKKWQRKQ
jgi:hypothetical protein